MFRLMHSDGEAQRGSSACCLPRDEGRSAQKTGYSRTPAVPALGRLRQKVGQFGSHSDFQPAWIRDLGCLNK